MAGKNIFPVPNVPLKILKILAAKKNPFVIVGGAAMALHGIPRSTIDIDIVVPAENEAVKKLFLNIQKTGLLKRDRHIVRMIDSPDLLIGQWITLQDKTGIELVDIFFENEKEFTGLLKRSKKIKGKKFNFYVASLDDLEKMKKKSARAIDLADIALIREKRGKKK
ncbi:MAG: hypothetical protein KJ957_06930 [Candidatus Omnitrophica bacterium]|nr:hypothetical protein [Candidatus Omnitrophota bacterium]